MKQIIVKVQLPLMTTSKQAICLVYDEEKTFIDELPEPKGLRKWMRGEHKKFFYAHIQDRMIVLDKSAPWQSW